MAITRSVAKKQKYEACSRNKSLASWLDLSHDVLLLILMELTIIDFVAFSGVCKMWRSFALSNWNIFMASRLPMEMLISTNGYKKECHLGTIDGRGFSTNIPHSRGRNCVGVTCGYLILFGNTTCDFWHVNPITRHELHFPCFPFSICYDPTSVRSTLVFSSSMSRWVFVISLRLSDTVFFSISGKQACWTRLSSEFPIHDLHAFQGKIYTLNTGGRIYEVSLNPKPTLTLVVMNEFQYMNLNRPQFVSSGKILYMVDFISKNAYVALQVDLDEMKWVSSDTTRGEFTYFRSPSGRGVAARVYMWAVPETTYERFTCFHGLESMYRGRWLTGKMWYVPRDCLNVNLLSDAYDGLT